MMNEFVFNDCGVCMNPNKHDFSGDHYICTIVTAMVDGSNWRFGYRVQYNKGSFWGASCGVNCKYDDDNFVTEDDAVKAGLRLCADSFERNHNTDIAKKVRANLCRQRTLFDF